MDFLVGHPRTLKGYDNIWVIADRLTKVAHFVSIRSAFNAERIVHIYI